MNIQKNTFMWALLIANLLFNMPTLLKADMQNTEEALNSFEETLNAGHEQTKCIMECFYKHQKESDKMECTMCSQECEMAYLKKIIAIQRKKNEALQQNKSDKSN